jgi:hypothetical protein
VWHHRRPTIRAFWKQQVGYGAAEAHLQRHYPGRFNWFGDLVWAGSIYDGAHTRLRSEGLPSLFRPRVYQGRFGSAQFQSIYQPFQTWWFQIFTTAEWHVLTLAVLLAAVSSCWYNVLLAAGAFSAALAMLGVTLAAAAIPAIHAVNAKPWKNRKRWQGGCLVMFLHLLQPIARTVGRVRGWWATRKLPPLHTSERQLWGNLSQRDDWLHWLPDHLANCGWLSRPCTDWDDDDIEVLGPGPYTLRLRSVYEEDLEHGYHFVRYRVTSRAKPIAIGLWAFLIMLLGTFVAIPTFAPLAIPVVGLMWLLWHSRDMMTAAVSQLAEEAATPFAMTRVDH